MDMKSIKVFRIIIDFWRRFFFVPDMYLQDVYIVCSLLTHWSNYMSTGLGGMCAKNVSFFNLHLLFFHTQGWGHEDEEAAGGGRGGPGYSPRPRQPGQHREPEEHQETPGEHQADSGTGSNILSHPDRHRYSILRIKPSWQTQVRCLAN